MTWLSEHLLELLLITVYLAVIARHGWVGTRHVHSIDDYLVAGRRMGGLVIALSFFATFMSTNTFIGAAGKSWDQGLVWSVGGVVLVLMATASWWLVAPRFVPLTRTYGSLTVPDFLGSHYDSQRVRQLSAVVVAFSSVLYLVAIYRGASIALEQFLDLPYLWCVAAIFFVVTAYTLTGGFESVVLTDAIQGVLMLVGAIAIAVALLLAGGGLPKILDTLREQDPKLVSWNNWEGLSAALAYSLAVGVKYLVEPRQLSRFYGLKDAGALRLASIVAPLIILITYVCLLPVGALARSVIPVEKIQQTDAVVPYLLGGADLLGPVLGTIFLLVLASAAMSSIDSVLLVAAAAIDRDLLPSSKTDERSGARKAVWRTRLWVVIVSSCAAGSVMLPVMQDIVQMTAFSGSLYGACFLPVLVVGLFTQRRSARVALVTIAAGATAVIGAFVLKQLEIINVAVVYPGLATGMLTFTIGNWFVRQTSRRRN